MFYRKEGNEVIKISDFKIKTGEALASWFHIKQFSFECLKGGKKEENQKLFQQIVTHMPVIEINQGIYYRARIIQDSDGEDTGIVRRNGVPISGFNTQYSGVAPAKAIKENGRVNRIGEQVLYLAEDIETSCKEQKANEDDYFSVAECAINSTIKVMDFTVMVSDGLVELFPDEIVHFFSDKYSLDISAFYMYLKKYLTSPDYKNQDYAVPLDFLDIVKERNDISGIKYISFYTEKYNIALWDENRNSKCTNSKVVK